MDEELRITDRERDAASTRLRTAFAEGRLDDGELSERLAAVYSAKTNSELTPVFVGLPTPMPPPIPVPGTPALASGWFQANQRVIVPALAVCTLVTIIWAITTPGRYFWPVWVYLGMAVLAGSAIFAGVGQSDSDPS